MFFTLTFTAFLLTADPTPRPLPPAIKVGEAPVPGKPVELKGQPGRVVRLEADAPGDIVWFTVHDGVDLYPEKGGKVATFVSPRPGKFHVFCLTAKGNLPSDPAVILITVGTPEPVPPGPLPPGPTPPKPVDPLVEKFRAAYTLDAEPALRTKADCLKDLVELYTQAVPFAGDPTVLTTMDLAGRLIAASKVLLKPTELQGVRIVLATVLGEQFPEDVPLTDASRLAAATLFKRLALALTEVGVK